MTTTNEPTDVELAQKFANNGVPIEIISAALGTPIHVLSRTLRRTTLTPEDEQLANAMRQMAWKAWTEAMWTLENGHPDAKLSLLRVILGKTAGLIGQESSTTFEESKEAVTRIFSQMRDVEESEPPTELDPYRPEPTPDDLTDIFDQPEAPEDWT